ncbi:MAG TPA: Gfo/Idh/MocA family oxidoreductase, partial [Gemmatimonadaceae bacterium]|nr:Gfo/Idh/MocA family oxidoreductase [Gemmatimonadaceae bacterium]
MIGAGAQGIAQSQGLKSLEIEVAGLAEIDPDRLKKAGDLLHLSQDTLFSSTEQMLARLGPLDHLCVATTAPSHVRLGRLGLKAGAKRVLLEKPVDISLKDARTFYQECLTAGVTLAVNYSRRWMLDYQAIERCIQGGFIGEARSISVMLGKGNLAMHASHYFDLCCFLFRSPPAGVVSRLEPIEEPNVRGAEFSDPSGHCLFSFQSGARAFLDFSSDLLA